MELQLISGRFAPADAEQILRDIFKVKIEFHERKIRTLHQTEESIEHAEKRIHELQKTLRYVLSRIKEGGREMVDLHAHIELSLAEPITQ
jgi:cob(I)alamin adenosyltransferase